MPTPSPTLSPAPDLHGRLIAVIGGGGFVGRSVAQALMGSGARLRIIQRNPRAAIGVKALGNLGQTQFVAADVTRPQTLERALAGVDAVVNLAGAFTNMAAVQAAGAGNVARAAAEAGAAALVHMSAIGADAASHSTYGRTKGEGEASVREGFPAATILRPSIIFGRDDAFINRFAGVLSMAPLMPVFAPATRFQPVFVGDVADAVAVALGQSGAAGRTYELGGPRAISMRALLEWIAAEIRRSPILVDLPGPVAGGIASAIGWLPGAPITRDQWLMLGRDNVVADGALDLADLGIVPTALEAVAPGWLSRYRRHGRFAGKAAA
jgi:NADH dehydrogenase